MSDDEDLDVVGLFEGYGGLTSAVLDLFGGRFAAYSEIEPAACRVLEHHHPDVPNLGDITAVDWAALKANLRRRVLLTGGFPCTDVSSAGKRAGLTPDTRSGLWAHMARAIHVLEPELVVIENVRGLLSADAACDVEPCPWCLGDGGGRPLRALGAVLGDLAVLGYDARWVGLRAADAGAPHPRFRIFILAWPAAPDAGRVDLQRRPVGGGVPGEEGPGAGEGLQRERRRDAAGDDGPAAPDAAPADARRVGGPGPDVGGEAGSERGDGRPEPGDCAVAAPDPAGPGRVPGGPGRPRRPEPADAGDSGEAVRGGSAEPGRRGGAAPDADEPIERGSGRPGGTPGRRRLRPGPADGGDHAADDRAHYLLDVAAHGFAVAEHRRAERAAADPDSAGREGREPARGHELPARGAASDTESVGRGEGRPEPAGLERRPDAAVGGARAAADADGGRREGQPERDGDPSPGEPARAGDDSDGRVLAGVRCVCCGLGGEYLAGVECDRGHPFCDICVRRGHHGECVLCEDLAGAAPDTEGRGDPDVTVGSGPEGLALGSVAGPGARGGARSAPPGVPVVGGDAGVVAWGDYAPAIGRWERLTERPAPAPTQTGARGGQQLAPRFVEWMMGLPEGWVTGVPGLSRNEQLKLLGNGVVPQQADMALRAMLLEALADAA